MFNIVVSASYTWPVKVVLPVSGGRSEAHSFDVEFRRLGKAAVQALQERAIAPEADPADLAREIVLGWSGVSDGAADIPFSDTALRHVLDIQGVAAAIVRAYFESVLGAARKN